MNLVGIKYQAMGPCLVMIGSQKYHLQYEVLNPSLSFCSCYGTGCAFVLYVLYNTIFGLSQAIYPMLVWLFKQKAE
jgi:hypothetical protein